MSSSSKSASKKYITERKIIIPVPKAMPVSIQRFLEEELKAEIEEWEKWNAAIKKMMRQSKKEKDARKSPRKEKVDVKSEKVARKSPSKEKVKADTKEWKFMIKQLRSELMQLSQKTRKLGK